MTSQDRTPVIANPNNIIPSYAWLTVNRRCNFRCEWCYAQGTGFSEEQEMSLEDSVKLTDILVSLGIRHLFVTGGEPTLWQPLLKFNQYCRDIQLNTTIITNAMRFGNDRFWERYITCPNTFVGVSLKAWNQEKLQITADVSQFGLVTRGIRRAMEYFQSGVGIVYNSYVTGNLVEMVSYAVNECRAQSVKIDFCSPVFINSQPTIRCVSRPEQMINDIVRSYSKIEMISNRISFIMSVPFCFWPQEFIEELKAKDQIESICHLVKRDGIIIGSDGSLFMCNELFDFPIGKYRVDFTDASSLLNLLNSKEVEGYYSEMSRYPSDKCRDCSWYLDCGGGCPLQWAVFDPDETIRPVSQRR